MDLASWQKRRIMWVCVALCSTRNFGPRYDVTKPFVLTRIRQDVSAGKCVAGMISPPRQHTSCSFKVLSASVAIANVLYLARVAWILEHPCDSWLWDLPKSGLLRHLARPGPWRTFVSLVHTTENERFLWLGMWTA